MHVIFIGGFYPKECIGQIRNASIGPIANANNALQWAYIDGLKSQFDLSNNLLNLISLPQIGAYPFRYKKMFFNVRKKLFGEKQGLNGICLNFMNIIIIKHISRYFSVRKSLFKLLKKIECKEDLFIVVYDLQFPVLKVINEMKKSYPKLYCCLIVPDLHGLTGGKQDFLHRLFEAFEKEQLERIYKVVDSYVLISKYMIERLPIGDKPWTVIEGIYNFNDSVKLCNVKPKITKNIFYSGALDERNGIHNLLEAFSLIMDPTYRLILCGDGYMRTFIEETAKKDYRIEFKGQLDRGNVLALQQEATLLVNPRPSSGEFTKYSFPSKTMEYFCSAIPVLMYRLDGIPDEYYDYCYTPKDESVGELKNSILEICSQSDQVLRIMGEKAQHFIETRKNSEIQTMKLLQLMPNSIWK